ncbi:uncharacterized protein SOCE26_039120 [Sorangium cellulosum]|uniref:CHAT domain-containing protein n=1 Tax=Sorangium cellulosum TaxID=56 RepID=A0A2L0ET64_SORCE|nr:CHAT domain-containing protein [Sorangium cellulosum]AUX42479.1 uncharacterized protein SOCE26_039120 [Sorangium cellulosum]
MSNNAPPWFEIAIEHAGDSVFVTPRGSLGQNGKKRQISFRLDDLHELAQKVGPAAMHHTPLDGGAREMARDLFAAIFEGEALEMCREHLTAARPRPLLLRLAVSGRPLQAVPWEVMLTPKGGALDTSGFLASSPRLHVVRAVNSGGPVGPLRILSRVRVLVISATSTRVDVQVKAALKEAIDAHAIELLDPIVGDHVATLSDLRKALQLYSQEHKRPHIVHIIGHGAVRRGAHQEAEPVLVLPGDTGDPIEIPAQTLADDLLRCFGDDLRLVVLDACEGAAPGADGSAAEILAKQAAVAVVAHLWPLRTELAGEIAKSFYTSLTLWEQGRGDVAASLHSVRHELQAEGAGAFSPVLYLRGANPLLFDFRGWKKRSPTPPSPEGLDVLEKLLSGPFSVLLGDSGEDPLECQMAFRKKLADKLGLKGEDALPLAHCIQRYALLKGRSELDRVFKEVVGDILTRDDTPLTPLAWELARALQPGVHATLLWLPVLEHALAERHQDRGIYVVQPPSPDDPGGSLWVMRRKAGEKEWAIAGDLDDGWPHDLDFRKNYVILRLYGGYLPKREVLGALLTEDDHALNPRSLEMPAWNALIHQLCTRPTFVVGISVLDWRHRLVLRLLFDQGLPPSSVAVLPLDGEEIERRIWSERGGGLSKGTQRRVSIVRQTTDALSHMLEGRPAPGDRR